VLYEIRVSGTVGGPLLTRKSPTCKYISIKFPIHKQSEFLGCATNRNFMVQYSPAVTLPPVTLFSQQRYFELGPKKFELSYFLTPSYTICSFFPPVKLFLPFSPQLSYFFALVSRFVSTIRPRSQSTQDPSQPKIPVSPRSQSAEDASQPWILF
jgi:hypothetical protein